MDPNNSLVRPTIDGPTTPENNNTTPIQQTPPKQHKNLGIFIAIAVLLLGLSGAGVWWFFLRDHKAPEKVAVIKKEIPRVTVSLYDTDPSIFYPDDVFGSYDMSQQVFEGLVGYDAGKLVPRLAVSWLNPDEKTWEIKLKKGVKFHTGREMKASDIKPSIDLVRDTEFYSTMVSTITDVKVIDDYTVSISTDVPDALLLKKLSFVYIIDTLSDKSLTIERGTGAYTLKSGTQPTAESVTLSPYDDYHQGRPLTRELVFKYFNGDPELTFENAEKGLLDAIQARPNQKEADQYVALGFRHLTYETAGAYGLRLNSNRAGPFRDKNLRKAVSLSLDREKIVKEVGSVFSSLSQTLPISTTGHIGSLPEDKQDLKTVKELLVKAGYKDTPIKALFSSVAQPEMPEVIKQLKAAGFVVAETDVSTDELFDKWQTDEYDMIALSYYSDFNDGSDVLRSIVDKDTTPIASYTNPELLALLKSSDSEFDDNKRVDMLQSVNQKYYEETAWVPIRTLGVSNLIKPEIKADVDFTISGLGIYFWKAYQE